MKKIFYSGKYGKGKSFTVSDKSFGLVSQYKWYLSPSGYATATIKSKGVRLQRLVTNCPSNLMVDHIDGDKSNYQLSNLRCVTASQNQANQRVRAGGTSKYKGVIWLERIKKWYAQIQYQKKRIAIGVFDSEKHAAQAYDKTAKKLFGVFAKLNLT